ncbi:MAG: hypothetical protein CL569_00715 [Alphaproteobacteria bacterium]|nr:hypothetical protein [Alphaproteobacteria bacterium]
MQRGYAYRIDAATGRSFPPSFEPHFKPWEMLEMGVFEGKYCNDCKGELPESWFRRVKTSEYPNPSLNCFKVKSRQSLSEWKRRGWIIGADPRGWFQWYCRFYLGRRIPKIDVLQIRRWRAFARHQAQVRKNCDPGDICCRPRQRQALLQWSYDPFI